MYERDSDRMAVTAVILQGMGLLGVVGVTVRGQFSALDTGMWALCFAVYFMGNVKYELSQVLRKAEDIQKEADSLRKDLVRLSDEVRNQTPYWE